jgi:hypothetical protein
VFISHSSGDTWVAQVIGEKIGKLGAAVCGLAGLARSNAMARRIFISYAHRDQDLANDLRARLKQIGDDIILVTPELKRGQDWSASIRSDIEKADEILVLLTPNSLQSSHVLLEVGAGTGLRKNIVPIVVGLDADTLPAWVRQTQFVKYSELSTYLHALAQKASNEAASVQRAPANAGVT